MRNLILKLLIKLYVNKFANKDIVKLSDEESLAMYQFKTSSDVIKVLKSNITRQTLRHFETTSEQERWMIKGASLELQRIKDLSLKAQELMKVKDKKMRLKVWKEIYK